MDKLIEMSAEIILVNKNCGPAVCFVIDRYTEIHWCQRHSMFHIIAGNAVGSVHTEEEVLDVICY